MPRTNGQTKRKTSAPAKSSTKATTTPSATPRRRTPRASAESGQEVHQSPPTILPAPDSQEDPQELLTTLAAPSDSRGPTDSLSPTLAAELTAVWPDLQALAHWWQARQHLAQQDETPDRKLTRQTYHIEQHFIDAVRREADLTGESYAAVVNRAFARYFTGK